ncbi:hypothetical protein RUM43_014825 [Polyplax serrata]|uniref:Major facilitator superfamily (MFS) profile domain-containing protein n=1 Tax=Polyplax serrata TaxID=468196 RepID=A0AAN8P420_POLSC
MPDGVPARVVLYMLSFTGFLVSFMMRTDMNIAMVAMAKSSESNKIKSNTSALIPSYCYVPNNETVQTYKDDEGEFDWSPNVQSIIISSFYWCYVLSQVAGGILTQKFGTKLIFGGSQLATAICALLIPVTANVHWAILVVLRSIQGIASGLTWPAMYAAVGHWIPSHERSRFMSSFQGFSFGIGVTYMMAGVLIANFGWRVVFYTTGTLGLVWCVFWYFFAFDEPENHPRISVQELEYIRKHIGSTVVTSKKKVVPWKKVLTSMPTWCIGITTFGRIWVHYTFMIPGPKYMKTILGLNIQENGLISGAPFISSYLSSVVFCYIADKLHTKNILSLTNIRKINTALSQAVPGIMLVIIGYLGCHFLEVFVLWFIAVTLITAAYAGAMASIVDIAPNFAGPVLAFAQTIHMSASFISPLVAGSILSKSESIESWRLVFLVAATVACVTYVSFQIFGTSKIQEWNYQGGKPTLDCLIAQDANVPLKTDTDDRTIENGTLVT